ncbi:MAG: response regulator [Lachnospiraceae bacterium]|jgi:two-component system response regulator YesN
MTSILIVDDESLIRRGLESMIPWERLDCRLVDQASNGEDGLHKIRQYHPDIVFTDIKMPKMDGLQMIEEAIKEPEHPIFIILSGYNDFELVRSAMRLGAIDYLIKLNLDEDELVSLIQSAQSMLLQRPGRQSSPSRSEDFKKGFIKEMLKLNPDKDLFTRQLPENFSLKDNCFYRVLYFSLNDQESAPQLDEFSQNFLDSLCIEQFPERTDISVHRLTPDAMILYVEYRDVMSPDILLKKCQTILNSVKRYLNRQLVIGISAPHQNIMHLSSAREEAMKSSSFHVSGIDSSIHFYTDFLNTESLQRQLNLLNTETLFFEAAENFMLQVQKFMSQSSTKPEDARQICFLLISKLYGFDQKSREFFIKWFGKEYTSSTQFEKSGIPELVSWLLHLAQGIDHYSRQYMTEIYRYKVKKAREYIYENRFQKISLNEVADLLEITPSYLSRIFKKVTHQSFSDYVAEVKIEEAKSLLLKDNNRIYEVSSILGYDDPYYFSKVFKKVTQMTPSEFIARN